MDSASSVASASASAAAASSASSSKIGAEPWYREVAELRKQANEFRVRKNSYQTNFDFPPKKVFNFSAAVGARTSSPRTSTTSTGSRRDFIQFAIF